MLLLFLDTRDYKQNTILYVLCTGVCLYTPGTICLCILEPYSVISCVRLRMENDEEQRQIQDADREQHHIDVDDVALERG